MVFAAFYYEPECLWRISGWFWLGKNSLQKFHQVNQYQLTVIVFISIKCINNKSVYYIFNNNLSLCSLSSATLYPLFTKKYEYSINIHPRCGKSFLLLLISIR